MVGKVNCRDSAPIDGFALVAAPLPGSDAVCSTMIEGFAEASQLYISVERQSNPLLDKEQSASLHVRTQAREVEVEMAQEK